MRSRFLMLLTAITFFAVVSLPLTAQAAVIGRHPLPVPTVVCAICNYRILLQTKRRRLRPVLVRVPDPDNRPLLATRSLTLSSGDFFGGSRYMLEESYHWT